jgi:hypothetical protein
MIQIAVSRNWNLEQSYDVTVDDKSFGNTFNNYKYPEKATLNTQGSQ